MSRLIPLGALVLAFATSAIAQAAAPGQNGRILFMYGATDNHQQIYTVAPDGTHIRQLTRFSDSSAVDASWSRDGKRVAFARDYDLGKSTEHLDIYTMNADGTGLHSLGLKGLNGAPTWFPDGRRLLFGHPGGLWVIPAAGGTPHLALEIVGDLESPTLSPNGRDVAFIRNRSNSSALFVANLGTGRAKQVTPWGVGAKPKVDWSPDASLLLSRNAQGVFTVRPDGSELTMLIRGENLCSESFSPDATKVLYVANCDQTGKWALFTASVDGTGAKRIPNVHGHWASWGRRAT